jgi:predicted alpha/beta-hydrolase family hydrolase
MFTLKKSYAIAEDPMGSVEAFQQDEVRGFLHRPEALAHSGLVLAHGAGADCKTKLLIAVAEAFCAAGVTVLRMDLPFRQARPNGPPSPAAAAKDREGLKQAAEIMRSFVEGPVIIGGHSYGGRQASMLATEHPEVAAGLLLLSYPLHPPRNREQRRVAHFPYLRTPSLFVHGTRDPFGLPDEMADALQRLAGPYRFSEVTGAGHDLRGGAFDIQRLIVTPLAELCPH